MIGSFSNALLGAFDLCGCERLSFRFSFSFLLGELGDFPIVRTEKKGAWDLNNSVGSVEVGVVLVRIERTRMFLAMVVFQRHVGCADCPGGGGDEGRVGASESGHVVVVVVEVQRIQFRMCIV